MDQIYVLYPVDKKNIGSLIKTRGLAWNLIEKFDNGGIEIGLFQHGLSDRKIPVKLRLLMKECSWKTKKRKNQKQYKLLKKAQLKNKKEEKKSLQRRRNFW